MTIRTTSRTVLFNHPFILAGFERVEPAGPYVVETDEEEMDGTTAAISVWRRINTVMHIHHAGMTEHVKIDPGDLEKALARDDLSGEVPAALAARRESDRTKNNARLLRRRKL